MLVLQGSFEDGGLGRGPTSLTSFQNLQRNCLEDRGSGESLSLASNDGHLPRSLTLCQALLWVVCTYMINESSQASPEEGTLITSVFR